MKAFYDGFKALYGLGTLAVFQFARKMARHFSQIVQAIFLNGQNTFTVSSDNHLRPFCAVRATNLGYKL